MAEILAMYVFIFKWQFATYWFYAWLALPVLGSRSILTFKNMIGWIAGSTVLMPAFVMLLWWSELFGGR